MSWLRHILTLILCFAYALAAAQDIQVNKTSLTYKDSLQLDFYPSKTQKAQPSPLILLVHGGGFASGSRDGLGERKFCQAMAAKGYAVASISYRLTRKNESFSCDCAAEKKLATFVSASEDLSDAFHFLMQEKNLQFDRKTVVLAGSSAGAETILHGAFMNDHYLFRHISPIKIAGLISFAGALENGRYITAENAVPTLFIHGKKDLLVPYATAPHHYCLPKSDGYLMLDGPETLTRYLKKYGTSYILAFDPEGGHDWASKAYRQTALIDRFLKNNVVNKQFVQEIIQLKEINIDPSIDQK
ncbi:MAG: alpha/beta hydrolase [Flavobacteriales bacterium]|nr:alpha/beta hydrolase [Flavobacteriales bacterium]